MATVVLGEVNGGVLSMEVDTLDRIVSATLDCSAATAPVTFKYPEDGSKVTITVQPGDAVSRTFTGNNRLSRVTTPTVKPNGEVVLMWSAPSWVLVG